MAPTSPVTVLYFPSLRICALKERSVRSGPTAKVSLDEGTAYADKAMIQFICAGDRCEMFTELIAREARTGRRGDGIVSIHPVAGVIKIRTGERGLAALA